MNSFQKGDQKNLSIGGGIPSKNLRGEVDHSVKPTMSNYMSSEVTFHTYNFRLNFKKI